MRYQIASDLHIEYLDGAKASDFIEKKSDILVLAGDIGSLYKIDQLTQFLKELNEFKKIIYIPGNHEFYMVKGYKPKPFNQLIKSLFELEKVIPNLVVLNCGTINIDGINFVGCTLWSDIGENSLPKYRVRIYGFSHIVYNQQYQKNLNFLKRTLQYQYPNTVVVTHYPPVDLVDNSSKNKFKYLYRNNLDYMIDKENMSIWNFGHIHINHSLIKNGVRLITNQKGRTKDDVQDFEKIFEIEL